MKSKKNLSVFLKVGLVFLIVVFALFDDVIEAADCYWARCGGDAWTCDSGLGGYVNLDKCRDDWIDYCGTFGKAGACKLDSCPNGGTDCNY